MKNYWKMFLVTVFALVLCVASLSMPEIVKAEEGSATATETPEEKQEETKEETKEVRYIKVDTATVYSKAKTSKSSKKLGKLHWQDQVTVIGSKGKYSRIEYKEDEGYVKTKYLAEEKPELDRAEKSYTRYIKKKAIIYKAPSVYANKAGSYKKSQKVTCIGTCDRFTAVKKGKKIVYVKTSYLTSKKPKKKAAKKNGASVAAYAKKFVGNPYKYGGTSLTKGADCSGFTMSVFKKFGIKLPHSSSAQRKYGKAVSLKNAKPGDLVCYSGHVGIYIGNGKIVHASTPKGGIKIGSVHIMKIKTIRRLL